MFIDICFMDGFIEILINWDHLVIDLFLIVKQYSMKMNRYGHSKWGINSQVLI